MDPGATKKKKYQGQDDISGEKKNWGPGGSKKKGEDTKSRRGHKQGVKTGKKIERTNKGKKKKNRGVFISEVLTHPGEKH